MYLPYRRKLNTDFQFLPILKRLSIILLSALVALSIFGQESAPDQTYDKLWNNDLSISAGPITSTPILTFLVEIANAISYSNYEARHGTIYGCYSLNYHYQVLSWLRVGAKAVYEGSGTDYYDKDTQALYANHRSHWADIMASVQFTYYNKNLWKLYSGLDAGIALYTLEDRYHSGDKAGQHNLNVNPLPAFDITIFGMTVGRRVYGMAELNLGMDAVVKAGIGMRF